MAIPNIYYNPQTLEVVDEQQAKLLKQNFGIDCLFLPLDAKVEDMHVLPESLKSNEEYSKSLIENSIGSQKKVKGKHLAPKEKVDSNRIRALICTGIIVVGGAVTLIIIRNNHKIEIQEQLPYEISETYEELEDSLEGPTFTSEMPEEPYVETNIVKKSLVIVYDENGQVKNFQIDFNKLINEFLELEDADFYLNMYTVYNDFQNLEIDGIRYENVGFQNKYQGNYNGQTNLDYFIFTLCEKLQNDESMKQTHPISVYETQYIQGWRSFLGTYQNSNTDALTAFIEQGEMALQRKEAQNELTAAELMNQETHEGGYSNY